MQKGDWNVPFWTKLVRDGKAVQGKGGWLFLANDSSDVLLQHSGERTLSAAEIERWRDLLEERTQRLARTGTPYWFLVAPDTHAVYSEELPDDIRLAAERPIHKLLNRLQQDDSSVRMIYPLAEMVAEKSTRQVCSAFDTHWSEFGAFVAYTRLLDELKEEIPVRQVPEGHVIFYTHMMPGELSVKLGFDDDVEQLAGLLYTRARLVDDNCVFNKGSHVVLECDEAPPTTCVLFGDSYAPMLLRYLAESFGRLVFAHMPTLDYELIEREQPDVVISLLAERFLIEVPDDSKGETVGEHARRKLELGQQRPRLPMWDRRPEPAPGPLPLETAERIRADLLSRNLTMDAALVSVIAYAALPPLLAWRLQWEDVTGDALRVAPPDENGNPRLVRTVGALREDLEQWRLACGSPVSGDVFQAGGREKWREAFDSAAIAAGVEGLNPADLVLCLGAILVRAGAGWEEVADQTGMDARYVLRTFGPLVEELYREGPIPADEQIRAARDA